MPWRNPPVPLSPPPGSPRQRKELERHTPLRGDDGIVNVTLTHGETPPSLNVTGTRGSHWVATRLKKKWQAVFEVLLMESRLPRGLESVTATAAVRFPIYRQRDEGNFRWLVEKSLGDALVNGGWLPSDEAGRYSFGQLSFEAERGPARTTIVIHARSLDAAA